ncbi:MULTISPECIES: inositol monophosphatase family protein [Streptomyces]|uniref:Inositol monophosphatase family protein n=1 Tax=Streptomyces xinghaiensis TaxID=1038928 RepID=A0A420UU29_9ACTN|nr:MULTISPECIES: inositol monophosphatase family protein [Streptomyces]OFA34001.1 monophosphatase [Streptomyces fradiae]PQM19699.1 inositol monophosphatase family protein [Streptomyces xinghaiensis]RKM90687.1 inositol monophosphatase family protein [Streptomyces xinghaiensis]RNC68555.1 inositol monophosphatase family protein [Streptomyces xinghaiensis]
MNEHHDLQAVAEEAVEAGVAWLVRAGDEWSEKRFKESGEEVTDADVEVERRVTRVLRERTPDIPVIGEESAEGGPLPERCWLLDPIDGTMNYTRGAPLHAVSLAYAEAGTPSVGVLHAPALHRRWSVGPRSAPSTEPSGVREVSRAIVSVTGTGSPRSRSGTFLSGLLGGVAYRVRMHGCMSLDLAAVAEGWLDACVCFGPAPWDVAAGVTLLRRNGLTVLGAEGRDFTFGSPILAAGHPDLAKELIEIWESLPANDGAGAERAS